MKALLLFIILNTIAFSGLGQSLLVEDFVYTPGNFTAWTSTGTGTVAQVEAGSLTHPTISYPPTVVTGNKLKILNGTNPDYTRTLSSTVTTGSVYVAFLLNVASTSSTAGAFLTLVQAPSNEFGKVLAKSSGSGYVLGVSRGAISYTAANFASTVLAYGTTYLVVMKYTFVAGGGNDPVDLFIDPASLTSEGTPNATADLAGTDGGSEALSIGSIRIREDANTPTAFIDAIRVSTNYANALPVELTYFRAMPTETNQVRVQWGTANEQNSKYFAIERSADALEFTEIARRDAAGNSKETLRYEILDDRPLPGTSYYRLRQVDTDGSEHLYRAVSVTLGGNAASLRVFPNPSDGRQLMVRVPEAQNATVSLQTISGAALSFFQTKSATDELALTPTQPLAPGIYLLSVKTNDRTQSQKIVVR